MDCGTITVFIPGGRGHVPLKRCPACRAARLKAQQRKSHAKWAEKNPHWHRDWSRAHNTGERAAKQAAWREANRDKARAATQRWRAGAKAHRAAYMRKVRSDPTQRLLSNTRSRIAGVMRLKGCMKSARTMELVGCSPQQLAAHMERQFTGGMSWDNYGKWHVDHIFPCVAFNLADAEEQRLCFHYSNLQPLWATDNIIKHGAHYRL